MRRIKKVAGFILIFLLCLGLTACSDKKEAEQAETEVLQEINQIPEDGIITEEEMKTIAGKEGEFKFCGEGNEFSYVWIYNGRMIKNPQEQNLKVNKIAARWHAKAVAQFFTFSKKGSDRIGPR